MNTSVVAVIPARSGSKSIKDKNVANLGGYPLLAYSIVTAKLSRRVGRVLLSTDSEHYAELGRRFGAEAPFLRPPEISTDRSTDRDFMAHAMEWMKNHDSNLPEYWVHLRPTTPLRNPADIDEAVAMVEARPEATALRSVHPSPESPFKWFRRNEQGFLTALTSDDTSLDRFNLPRQTYPEVFIPNGYVDIVRSSFVLGSSLFHGDRVIGYVSPPCTEVDSPEELERIEFELKKNGSPLFDYLKKHWRK